MPIQTFKEFLRAFCDNNGIAYNAVDKKALQADYRRAYPMIDDRGLIGFADLEPGMVVNLHNGRPRGDEFWVNFIPEYKELQILSVGKGEIEFIDMNGRSSRIVGAYVPYYRFRLLRTETGQYEPPASGSCGEYQNLMRDLKTTMQRLSPHNLRFINPIPLGDDEIYGFQQYSWGKYYCMKLNNGEMLCAELKYLPKRVYSAIHQRLLDETYTGF